jgi:hypothetical protein
MDEKLISKKDLLEKYGISYGALYRWKRKGLIPDDWFIKKATVTGQETFFPEQLVCERVELIQTQKDDASLDELAKKLSGMDAESRRIVLLTAFGEKSYRFTDITSIIIATGTGEEIEIFDQIKSITKK